MWFRCMWVNNVQLCTLHTTVCRLHHDCWLHCSVSRTEPTRIIKNHINGVLGACEWTVCNCVHYRWQSIRCITIVDCIVPHHDCWLPCSASCTKPTQIIEKHINAILGACEWIVCSCIHYRRQSVYCIMTIDCTVLHCAPSSRELLRTTLMRFSVHVSEWCAITYIIDDILSVASWLLIALFHIAHRAHTNYLDMH